MRIHNLRAGFATNSSSSHSVILLPPQKIGKVGSIASDGPDSFQWEHFRLVGEEEKLRYIAAQLFQNYYEDRHAVRDLVSKINQEIPGYADEYQEVIDELTKGEPSWSVAMPSVDHQSVITLPSEYNPALTDKLIQFFLSPTVAVLGGNDNTDKHPNKVRGAKPVTVFNNFRDRTKGSIKVRQDGDYWVMFDSQLGNKVRFSFNADNLEAEDYAKSFAPELVDVKITDWCDKGCKFCYQSSTKAGVHASLEKIEQIADLLVEMQVFEVALGGGETTAHPEFAQVLRLFSSRGIIPNFTTFSDRWLSDERIVQAVCETVGGIGVSCLDAKGLKLAEKIKMLLYKISERWRPQLYAQHVVGSVPYETTVDFIKAAAQDYIHILLLGFKDVGFGAKYERFDDDSFETYLKLAVGDHNIGVGLSIDTALLNRYPSIPATLNSHDALVTPREGAFSCYIDAVTGHCGASSYVPTNELKPLPNTLEGFLELYASF